MTTHRFSPSRIGISSSNAWLGGLLGLSLAAIAAPGCGGAADPMESTDTGNPPVIMTQKLHITASDDGVIVAGDAGAVTGGARVNVTNSVTGAVGSTTAAADGSFAVEITGSVTDGYRVEAEIGDRSSSAVVNPSGNAAQGLAGFEFQLDSSTGFTPVEDTNIVLGFSETELNFHAGCNGHFATYTVCDDRLCVGGFSSTLIGCEQPLQAQDDWLASFLTNEPAFERSGSNLTLTGSAATLQFLDREVADPDRPLAGPTWRIDTLIEGGAASGGFLGPVPTVLFGADGTLSIFTGCNAGAGTYTVSGQNLTLSETAYNEEGCNEPPGVAAVEQHVIDVLSQGTLGFEIERNRLTLMNGNIGISGLADE